MDRLPDDRGAAEAFLRRFHARHPGVTTTAYARGRDADGRSSYQRLARLVPAGARVLDLGCGDGHLLELLRPRAVAGLDLSEAELAAARARPALADALLVQGRAQALPFADAGFDACVSHLAFTLMDEPARVAAEVARVLRPGGVFAAVVGGGPAMGDGGNAFDALLSLLASAPVSAPVPRLGEARVRNPDSLAALLAPAGLALRGFDRVVIELGGSVDEVWSTLATLYELDGFDDAGLVGLRARFAAVAAELARDGVVPCAMAVGLVTCARVP